VGGGIGYAVRSGESGATHDLPEFLSWFESEADYLGLQYMYKTGYDPQAFVSFFEKLRRKRRGNRGRWPALSRPIRRRPTVLESHRKKSVQSTRAAKYVVSTSEFDDVKSRLASIENRHKVLDDKEGTKPSLRRTSSSDKSGKDDKTDDDRPTLKRRDDTKQN